MKHTACIGATLASCAARRRNRCVPRNPHVHFDAGPVLCTQPLCPADAGQRRPGGVLREQPARRRTRRRPQAGSVRGKTPAHGKAARSAARMRSH
ncbi:hypothetical protein J4732_08075, partial [Serratia marcescens]|nr:hypothetical protein [Serratia marcescens]